MKIRGNTQYTKYYATYKGPKKSYGSADGPPMSSSNGTEQLTRLKKPILKFICPTDDDYQEKKAKFTNRNKKNITYYSFSKQGKTPMSASLHLRADLAN